MPDKIILKDAKFRCHIGVTEEERKHTQEIAFDIEMHCDTKKAAASKKLEDALNYSEVHEKIEALIENNEYVLIETLAEEIAKEILNNFNADKVKIELRKPEALIHKDVTYPAIVIERKK